MNSATGVQTTGAASITQEHIKSEATAGENRILETFAHELRQPLSAIESTAYYLGLVLQKGDTHAREHAVRLSRLVGQANWILACGLQFSDSAPLRSQPLDLEELISETVAARILPVTKTSMQFVGDLPLIHFDPSRARALFEVLLDLSEYTAKAPFLVQLRTYLDSETGFAALHWHCTTGGASSVADLGCGASLCLEGAKRIVEAHGGRFTSNVGSETGLRLEMVLP